MPQIRKILCPVDFSETSDRAVAYAVRLARQLGASIELVHVWGLPVYALPDGAIPIGPESVDRITRQLSERMSASVARAVERDAAVSGRILQGEPGPEIVAAAQRLGASMIVMGTHGRTGISRLFLGSVAERVVRTARVPVLTVPPDRPERDDVVGIPGSPSQRAPG